MIGLRGIAEAVGRTARAVVRLAQLPPSAQPGGTPYMVMHRENKWRLLRYPTAARAWQRPVLIVPSLINRYGVLDLLPERSLVRWLSERGHDVWLIDWGTPGPEDAEITLDTIAGRYLGRAARIAARTTGQPVHLLGYCLGGTLATMYTAAFPEHVASLTNLAAPIDFHRGEGVMASWARDRRIDVAGIAAAFGNIPAVLLQASFTAMRPTVPWVKVAALLDRSADRDWLRSFAAVESWASNNVPFAGRAYVEWIERMYRDNALRRGGLTLEGRPVALSAIRCPVLTVAFDDDHIVAVESAEALHAEIRSPDAQRLRLPGGHVGAVVGRRASTGLWPSLSAFWAQRDGAEAAASLPRAS